MNYFFNNDEERLLVEFIAKYQYLNVNDAKYFFSSESYYRKRVTSLVKKGFLRRKNWNLVLDRAGIEYAKLMKIDYNPLNRNKAYLPRLFYMSHLAAFYHNCDKVSYKPSFDMKDVEAFTTTSRRYIGELNINGFTFLTYYISSNHDKRYAASVAYDIQKERFYKRFIVFVDDINSINLDDFACGHANTLIIENTDENREKLKYYNNVQWSRIIEKYYNNEVYLSGYHFCDYTDYENKFVSTFQFLDVERISRIRGFLRVNEHRNTEVVCSSELVPLIKKILPDVIYVPIDLDEYTVKVWRYYS